MATTVTIHSGGKLAIVAVDGSVAGADLFPDDTAFDCSDDLVLAGLFIAAGVTWTVTILATGATFTPIDMHTGGSYGTLTFTNPAMPDAADVRYGTAVGITTGTLRVPAASDVRQGVLVDAGTGTLVIGPTYLL